jgi:membrane protease YdiL (CAAX protease family)
VSTREPAPIPDRTDAAGDRYPQLLRTPQHRWWRPLLGLLIGAVAVTVAAVVVILVALAIEAVQGHAINPGDDATLTPDSPLGLLANNLVLATLIPAALLAVWAAHRARVGWLASVVGRLRWSVLWRFFLLAMVIVVVFFAASFAVPPAGFGDIDPPPASTLVGLLVVILLTTPLQSAAEEVGFRGYLSQAVASWFARPITGTLVAGAVSATLFALAHGGQEPALFTDRFAFGAVASWLVWRTGGLEASIALHAANNLVSLGYTASTGSVQEALENATLGWPYALLDMAMMLVFAAAVARVADRWGLVVRRPWRASLRGGAAPATLAGPDGFGYPGSRSSLPPPAGSEPPWGMG